MSTHGSLAVRPVFATWANEVSYRYSLALPAGWSLVEQLRRD